MIRSFLSSISPDFKPGFMFFMRFAWESRTRLPLLLMSTCMALGINMHLIINIQHAARILPRIRPHEIVELFPTSDANETIDMVSDSEFSEWDSDEVDDFDSSSDEDSDIYGYDSESDSNDWFYNTEKEEVCKNESSESNNEAITIKVHDSNKKSNVEAPNTREDDEPTTSNS